jgi:hypothetical protein
MCVAGADQIVIELLNAGHSVERDVLLESVFDVWTWRASAFGEQPQFVGLLEHGQSRSQSLWIEQPFISE